MKLLIILLFLLFPFFASAECTENKCTLIVEKGILKEQICDLQKLADSSFELCKEVAPNEKISCYAQAKQIDNLVVTLTQEYLKQFSMQPTCN